MRRGVSVRVRERKRASHAGLVVSVLPPFGQRLGLNVLADALKMAGGKDWNKFFKEKKKKKDWKNVPASNCAVQEGKKENEIKVH